MTLLKFALYGSEGTVLQWIICLLQPLPVSPYTGFRLLAKHLLPTSNSTIESATLTWEIGSMNTHFPSRSHAILS